MLLLSNNNKDPLQQHTTNNKKQRILVCLIGILILLCHPTLFIWKIIECWLSLNTSNNNNTITLLVISDIHVLGLNRNIFDILWTTFHLRMSLDFIVHAFSPHVVTILGDHLDVGGRFANNPETWNEYVLKYQWITQNIRSRVEKKQLYLLEAQIGNHDAAMGYMVTPEMLQRFETSFGMVNQMKSFDFTLQDGKTMKIDFITINSLVLDGGFGQQDTLDFIKLHSANMKLSPTQVQQDGSSNHNPNNQNYFRVLLTHIPLFRVNDLSCGETRLRETGHITYVAPNIELIPNVDVLKKQTSDMLLMELTPDLILSGHLHAECIRQYNSLVMNESSTTISNSYWELTVPTFSYRMRPDPGYGLVTIPLSPPATGKIENNNVGNNNNNNIHVCYLPNEMYLFLIVASGGMCIGIVLIWSCIIYVLCPNGKSRNFVIKRE
jgi:hypothetical protein